ncbi:MAG TPA: FAD-dependent oxidoreductase [Nitrososphaeraceae archaeon]|nr:FAD-dependent oxidoreductase [Nitrososphaeraceae archaeon]
MRSRESHYDIAIIGAGILGASIAYFLSSVTNSKIMLVEQEKSVALHTSGRNTGKVHAPFLYDPIKKKFFAKAASLGYDMWKDYCRQKSLPFIQDGVMEVATREDGVERLNKYMLWGEANGLRDGNDFWLLDKNQVKEIEPNVSCISAILCEKDASVNFGAITQNLIEDSCAFGCEVLLGNRLKGIFHANNDGNIRLMVTDGTEEYSVTTQFLINSAGGNAVDIAHSLSIANKYTDFHFRGEYWQAPPEYHDLTNRSIYSVPKFPEYPFLDPHWIVRIDGRREVGPNAVPVFGPYAYNWITNAKNFIPKLTESIRSPGIPRVLFDKKFLSLLGHEVQSSLSKTVMINRVKEFLPMLKATSFLRRGTSGVRSSLISPDGKFVPDTMVLRNDSSISILNYNSPGATGALPIGAAIAYELLHSGIVIKNEIKQKQFEKKSIWDIQKVSDEIKLSELG